MKRLHASALRRISVALFGALLLVGGAAGTASALPYDGTNPKNTICWDGSNPVWTLGTTIFPPVNEEGEPTPIEVNGILIATVEIMHSRKCATVWTRVKNYTGATAQVKEALVTYTNSNGAGRVEHWYPTVDTVVAGGTGWSNQYRDRASFSAKGAIFYQGAWRYGETPRSVAWVQRNAGFADEPYGCDGTPAFRCNRWPTLGNGNSVTRQYWIDPDLSSMPKAGGGTINVSGDIVFMFNEFNDVPSSNPFFFQDTQAQSEVKVSDVTTCAFGGQAGGFDNNGDYLYDTGIVDISRCYTWTSSSMRSLLCHEFDHLMGLHHVWETDSDGVTNVGSKATCIGKGSDTGPRIDDDSALADVYSSGVP